MEGTIYNKGKKGDIVVLDNITLCESELSSYAQPAFFTIVEVKRGLDGSMSNKDMLYVLKDTFGKEFIVSVDEGWWLVELTAWAKAKDKYHMDRFNREHLKVKKLNYQIEVLKDILIHQGVRIVSDKQLKDLGIESDIS